MVSFEFRQKFERMFGKRFEDRQVRIMDPEHLFAGGWGYHLEDAEPIPDEELVENLNQEALDIW